MEEELASRGIPVHLLDYRGLSLQPGRALPLFRDARRFFQTFARILEERRVAILHAYLPAANILAMAGSLHRRPRVRIVSKRALCRYKEGHPAYSHFEDLANFAADAVLVNSRAVAEDVRRTERCVEGKMFLVYNGLELPGESPAGGRPPLPPDLGLPPDISAVAYVANLREDKGHLCLIEAARRVVSAIPSTRFLLVGREDREAAPVREKIRELGLDRHVVLTGVRRDIPAILRATRVVAHPGEQEGMSNAILEAMAAGVPVVASNAGGNPEVVEDGKRGCSCHPAIPSLLHPRSSISFAIRSGPPGWRRRGGNGSGIGFPSPAWSPVSRRATSSCSRTNPSPVGYDRIFSDGAPQDYIRPPERRVRRDGTARASSCAED